MRNAGRTSMQAALEPGKTASGKPGENLQMEGGGVGHTTSHCRSARSLLWSCLQESSPALHQGMEQERLLRGIVPWAGWKGRFSFLPPWKGHREHGEAGETMHLKPEVVAQEQDYFYYLSAFENSAWRELNPRSEWGCEGGLQTCPLPSSLCRKKAFSNRNFDRAITLWTLQIYIYETTYLIYVQDRSLRCQKILSEKTRHLCTRG